MRIPDAVVYVPAEFMSMIPENALALVVVPVSPKLPIDPYTPVTSVWPLPVLNPAPAVP